MKASAEISPCGTWRYSLERRWDAGAPALVVCMLNPSTADASQDDPTIGRMIALARRLGRGGLHVVNLYGLRSTKPAALAVAADPVGPGNDAAWRAALAEAGADGVLAAWGAQKGIGGQVARFRRLCTDQAVPLLCLDTTAGGQPRHPLYVKGSLDPRPWR